MKKYITYIYALLVAFVGFILFKAYQKFSNFTSNTDESEEQTQQNQEQLIQVFDSVEINNTSISIEKAILIADTQMNSMNSFWGTDESVLFSTLENLNIDDLNSVAQKFGLRAYSPLNAGSPSPIDELINNYSMLSLGAWYQYELNSSELDKMRAIWSGTILDNTF